MLRRLPCPARSRESGQALVEFTLAFPLFMLVLVAIVEFAFAANALLAISFAARDASAIAAQACGDGSCGFEGAYPTADCQILRSIERDVSAPAETSRITAVSIYWTDAAGAVRDGGAAATIYTRGGATECDVEGSTVPYTLVSDGYPQAARCSILSGCPHIVSEDGGLAHLGLDIIGVRIDYNYRWHTPYSALFGSGGSSQGLPMSRGAEMRMEPTL